MTETQTEPRPTTDSDTPEQPSKAVAKVNVGIGVPLTTLDETWRMAQNLALAQVLPKDLRGKPSDVFAILAYGQELRLGPMQSLQAIYVVRGKPQLAADTWTALARREGHKVRWGHCDDRSATVTIARKDDLDHPLTETFTIDDAVKAGLCTIDKDGNVRARGESGKPGPWETYTKRMLRNRVVSFCGKLQCPEVALGFGIEGDYDYIDDDPQVTVTQPDMHRGPIPQDELQRAVAEAEQAYRAPTTPTVQADPSDDAPVGTVDAEVEEDQPRPAGGPLPDDQDMFAAADREAEAELARERGE